MISKNQDIFGTISYTLPQNSCPVRRMSLLKNGKGRILAPI